MIEDEEFCLVVKCVSKQKKILKMVIRKQLQNMVSFFQTLMAYNYFIMQFSFSSFTLV